MDKKSAWLMKKTIDLRPQTTFFIYVINRSLRLRPFNIFKLSFSLYFTLTIYFLLFRLSMQVIIYLHHQQTTYHRIVNLFSNVIFTLLYISLSYRIPIFLPIVLFWRNKLTVSRCLQMNKISKDIFKLHRWSIEIIFSTIIINI